jgi:hypothetical protein
MDLVTQVLLLIVGAFATYVAKDVYGWVKGRFKRRSSLSSPE